MSAYKTFGTTTPLVCFLLFACPGVRAQIRPPASQLPSIQDPTRELLDKDKALKRKIRLWEWTLSQIAKRENATIFMDAPIDLDPPNIAYDKPYGIAAMKALANGSNREWKQVSGIQTFVRPTTRKETEQVTAALNWLAALPDDDLNRLAAGKDSLSDLDPQTQDTMLGLAGWEPDMNFALLGKSGATQVSVIIGPKFRFTDPKTGITKEVTIPIRPQQASGTAHPTPRPAAVLKPLDRPAPGALNFGTGAILTLSDVVKRAEQAFHLAYVVDARVGDNRYFVSGDYNKPDFEAVLDRVTTVPSVRTKQVKPDRGTDLALLRSRLMGMSDAKLDVTRLRDSIPKSGSADIDQLNQQFGEHEELNASDFLQQKSMTASALCQGMPGLAFFLKGEGVGPGTMLSLDADFGLAFQADGQHLLSHGSFEADGQLVPVWSPNEVMVGLQ